MSQKEKRYWTLWGGTVSGDKVVGYCRLHKRHLTAEQMRRKQCIPKGCGAYDPEDGYWKPNKDGLGFAHVFDEINRLIPTKTGRPYIRYLPEGGEMERARKLDEEKKKAQS